MSITKAKRDKIAKEILEYADIHFDDTEIGREIVEDEIHKILKKHLAPGLKPSSAKGKGRRQQQWLQKRLLQIMANLPTGIPYDEDHIRSTPMGVSGEDLQLSPTARKLFPFAFECKNSERIGFWPTVEQAVANAGRYIPVILFGKNRSENWIALPAKVWLRMLESLAWMLRDDEYQTEETILDYLEMHGLIQKEKTVSKTIQSNP